MEPEPTTEAPAGPPPTIGRIVHFHSDANGDMPEAAIITYVHSESMVNLTVFNHNGTPFSRTSVEFAPERVTGMFACYPPRV